jgi:hypothetical protein
MVVTSDGRNNMIHLQAYQKFHQALLDCREILTLSPIDVVRMQQSVAQMQQLAGKLHNELGLEGLPAATAHGVEAFQVEINKQLQLLKVDLLFLRTAKQGETIAQRLVQIEGRFDLLEKYCEAVMAKLAVDE